MPNAIQTWHPALDSAVEQGSDLRRPGRGNKGFAGRNLFYRLTTGGRDMGARLEGGRDKRQVVPVRVLSKRGEFDTRFEAPVMVHKLYEVVCSKVTKQVVTKINMVIADGTHSSVSDVIRKALALYLEL